MTNDHPGGTEPMNATITLTLPQLRKAYKAVATECQTITRLIENNDDPGYRRLVGDRLAETMALATVLHDAIVDCTDAMYRDLGAE
jgi:hypothetical protein